MRFVYVAVILAGMLMLLNFGGFQTPTTGSILSATGIINSNHNLTLSGVKSSSLYSSTSTGSPGLEFILTIFLGAGLVLGAFGRAPDISYIVAGFVWVIVGLLTADTVWVWHLMDSMGVAWITGVATLLLGTMTVLLFLSAIDYMRGSD